MRDQPWKVIGRGINGWHAKNDTTSLSGAYGDDDGTRLARNAVDGALVYDAQDADLSAFSALVTRGPMINTEIPPDMIESFSSELRRAALEMAPALGGGFQAYALAAQDPRCTSLDLVGVGVYEGLLRKVPGVRIGRVMAGAIVWEKDDGIDVLG